MFDNSYSLIGSFSCLMVCVVLYLFEVINIIFSACRWTLEGLGSLEPRRSALEDDFEEEEEKEEDDQLADGLDSAADDKVKSLYIAYDFNLPDYFLFVDLVLFVYFTPGLLPGTKSNQGKRSR